MKSKFSSVVVGLLSALTSPVARVPVPVLAAAALVVGDQALMLEAKDADGWKINLKQLLEKGPMMLCFYRGQ